MSAATSSANPQFTKFVEQGNPVGEVVGVNQFIVHVKGLNPANAHAMVIFEDGSKGFINHIYDDHVLVLHQGTEKLRVGTIAVIESDKLVTRVGKSLIGRVVNAMGEPLDGKGPIPTEDVWPIFNPAPPIFERELLDLQLETGVIAVDGLFPIVRGQRLAILGDNKSGKTTLATQITLNQKNTDIVTVYVLIGKRRSDIDELLTRLNETDSLKNTIVVVSTLFESLIMTYLAPYIGCAMAEYLWQACDQETMVIYDDLTSHAQAYREVALLSNVSPGRDSYPGDMFYAHSSLLERAGKLKRNNKTLTCLPIVLTPNNDITAYLPTNIMSITDGQWIMDMEVFLAGHRPALSTGLSVTRVGGVGQNKRQKSHTVGTLKALATYRQAEEYAHFGSELALSAHKDLARGKTIYEVFSQPPTQTWNFMEQQLMLDITLNTDDTALLDVKKMKEHVREIASQIKEDSQFDGAKEQLIKLSAVSDKPAAAPAGPQELSKPPEVPPNAPTPPAPEPPASSSSTKVAPYEPPARPPSPQTTIEPTVPAAPQELPEPQPAVNPVPTTTATEEPVSSSQFSQPQGGVYIQPIHVDKHGNVTKVEPKDNK
ncbi:MAG: sodium-transporting two-sector ATPase [bacterium]|nr:sodium-transporting two-sector ATPase [bacterium]